MSWKILNFGYRQIENLNYITVLKFHDMGHATTKHLFDNDCIASVVAMKPGPLKCAENSPKKF